MARSSYSGGTRRVSGKGSVGTRRVSSAKRRESLKSGSAKHIRAVRGNNDITRRSSSKKTSGSTRSASSRTTARRRVYPSGSASVRSNNRITRERENTQEQQSSVKQKKRNFSAIGNLRSRLVREGDIDYTLLFLIILIVAIGLIMMLSASAPSGSSDHGDPYYYFKRQLIFIVMGFAGMYIISKVNLERFLKHIPLAFVICVVLLILVLIPGIGVEVNGARRWLNIPLIQLQPSELMKPVIAMYIAFLIKTGFLDLKTLKSNIVCVGIIGVVALLLMLETHLSGTLVIVGIAACVMIAGGTPIKPIVFGGLIVGALVFIYLQFDPTRMARITSFMDPFADAQGTGYQISQSIYAIGSGKLFGLGLGQSVQKYSNLPEPYNDFIFAIICEELGFVGAVVIILLFAALFIRVMRIAVSAPDIWSSLTCIGIGAQLGIQTFLNIGVAVSLIPNTGISLPFFSYGGTSILTLLLEMGILLNVSRRTVKE